MKQTIIKGAKPANTSKTSTSNSTPPKTSAKESSTSTTSKKTTADTNPTTGADTPKQSAVGSKVVVACDYAFEGDHAIWVDTFGEELTGHMRDFVYQLAAIGHTVVLFDREGEKHPRITLLASLMQSAQGLSAEDLIADAHRRAILNLDDDIKREVVALKRKALPMCNHWIEDVTNAEANGEDMEAYLEEARGNLEVNFTDDIFFQYID